MDIFHVLIPLKHAEIVRKVLSEKLPGRDDIFGWTCIARSSSEPICVACEAIPEEFMVYVQLFDPDKFSRYFFWRVDKESMVLQETNSASSLKDIGSPIEFKECVSAAGYRLRRLDG